MSIRQLDNDNPTIFAPITGSSRRKTELWDDQSGAGLNDSNFCHPSQGRGYDLILVDEHDEGRHGQEEHSDSEESERLNGEKEDIDAEEVFDLLRSVTDPEHPVSLEQLRVVSREDVHVSGDRVLVYLTPTIPHCSMSTLIGLSLRVRLLRALPARYRVDLRIKPGTHQSEHAVNKQLNDKERVQAALENTHLLQVVEGCLATAGRRGAPGPRDGEGTSAPITT